MFRIECFACKSGTHIESVFGSRDLDFSGRVPDCTDCGYCSGDSMGQGLETKIDLHIPDAYQLYGADSGGRVLFVFRVDI